MKLKIVSDGTVVGTKITDEDGRHITNIKAIKLTWEAHAYHGNVTATIDCLLTPCEINIMGTAFEESRKLLDAMKEREA